jgi:hypothetical protein
MGTPSPPSFERRTLSRAAFRCQDIKPGAPMPCTSKGDLTSSRPAGGPAPATTTRSDAPAAPRRPVAARTSDCNPSFRERKKMRRIPLVPIRCSRGSVSSWLRDCRSRSRWALSIALTDSSLKVPSTATCRSGIGAVLRRPTEIAPIGPTPRSRRSCQRIARHPPMPGPIRGLTSSPAPLQRYNAKEAADGLRLVRVAMLALAQLRVRRRQPRDRNTRPRAGHIIQARVMAEADR